MATVTLNVPSDSTTNSAAYVWMHGISSAMKTLGWTRTNDTGQLVFPVSIVSISNAVAASGTVTFTYALLQGSPLRVGGNIVVTNCTTVGLNATYTIASLPTGSTFTAATATTVTEAETAFGGVNPQVSITNAIGNGSTNTYTYTVLDGVDPIPGQSIVMTGCTTSGFNGTFTIGSVNTGTTTFITTTGISHATEVETGTGLVTAASCNSTRSTTTLSLTNANYLYEMWQMADAIQSTMPVIMKLEYGSTNNATNWGSELAITFGTSSNGAGVITGIGTGRLTPKYGNSVSSSGQNTSPGFIYMSGSTNRLLMSMFAGAYTASLGGFFSIERSHDSSGNDTNSYVTLSQISGGNSGVSPQVTVAQITFNTSQATVTETKLAAITKTGTLTGSFGSSTLLSPVFPVVGAVGNPCTNLLVGKAADWTDQTQFPLTLYGSSRIYQIGNNTLVNAAGKITNDTSVTAVIAFRYD